MNLKLTFPIAMMSLFLLSACAQHKGPPGVWVGQKPEIGEGGGGPIEKPDKPDKGDQVDAKAAKAEADAKAARDAIVAEHEKTTLRRIQEYYASQEIHNQAPDPVVINALKRSHELCISDTSKCK